MEQRRLGLQALGPQQAQKKAVEAARALVANRDLPDWWHQSVAAAREEIAWTLQTLSANALELNDLWMVQGFSSRCEQRWTQSCTVMGQLSPMPVYRCMCDSFECMSHTPVQPGPSPQFLKRHSLYALIKGSCSSHAETVCLQSALTGCPSHSKCSL